MSKLSKMDIEAIAKLRESDSDKDLFLDQVRIAATLRSRYPDLKATDISEHTALSESYIDRLFLVSQMYQEDIDELRTVHSIELSEPEQISILVRMKDKYSIENGFSEDLSHADLAAITGFSRGMVTRLMNVRDPQNEKFLVILKKTKEREAVANTLSSFKKLSENAQAVFFKYFEQTKKPISEQTILKAFTFESTKQTITSENLQKEVFDRTLKDLKDSLARYEEHKFETVVEQIPQIDNADLRSISYENTADFSSIEKIRQYITQNAYSDDFSADKFPDDEQLLPEGELVFNAGGKHESRIVITRKICRVLIHRLTGETDVPVYEVLPRLFRALKALDKK